jgi:hypothetical protein
MFKKSIFYLFLLLIVLNLIVISINFFFLNSEELIGNFYSEQLAKDQVKHLIESQKKWIWFGYVIIPFLILLRISLVSLCLSIGLFFYDMENKIKFKELFSIALIGEFIFVLVGFFKFSYFYFIKVQYTLDELQQFYPLSYTNFLDLSKIEPWLVYPLQTINLFEIAYFFIIVYGLHKLLKKKYIKSLELVAVSYGTGLVIWLGLVMFLTLNIS